MDNSVIALELRMRSMESYRQILGKNFMVIFMFWKDYESKVASGWERVKLEVGRPIWRLL